DAFEQLLTLIAPLRAAAWPDGPDAALGEVVGEVVVRTADGTTHTLTVGPRFAVIEGPDELFVVDDALRNRLAAEYRPGTVIDLVPEDIDTVTRTLDGETRKVTLADNRYTWDGEEPLGGAAAAALFDTLAGLRVER